MAENGEALHRGTKPPAGFIEILFGRADNEDLARYTLQDLHQLAESAYRHLAEPRQAGRPDIRLIDHSAAGSPGPREFTVLEVINDDMPFLLDSTLAELVEQQDVEPALVVHPILAVERNQDGSLRRLVGEAAGAATAGARRESFLHIHINRIDDPGARARLIEGLTLVCNEVRIAVADWVPMRTRLFEATEAYRAHPPPLPRDELAEAVAFLEWIRADNFTFLGVREYRFPEGDVAADPVQGTGLGLLRDPNVRVLGRGRDLVIMTPAIRAFLERPRALIIAKANVKSHVHRTSISIISALNCFPSPAGSRANCA